MENAAHTLSGLVLARLGPDRHGPFATALLVTAANFPDVDCVSALIDLPTYLRWHHGITHSALGILIAGPLLGLVFASLSSWRRRPVRLSTFVGLAYLGLIMHFALDAMINYGIRPWLPFDDTWYYGDVIFVADPWVWWMLGAGAALGGPRHGGGVLAWALFATATVVLCVVAYHAGLTPFNAAWVLAPMWGLVLGLRTRGVGEGRRARFSAAASITFALYVLCLFWMGRANHTRGVVAIQRFTEFRGGVVATSCTPVPCVPWRHRVIVETTESIFVAVVDGASAGVSVEASTPNHLGDPRLAAFAAGQLYRTWREFARHPVARWWDGAWILGDARYPDGWCDLRITVE